MALDDPALLWIWAVWEQETLWMRHDGAIVEKAMAGWGDDDLKAVLSTYSLLRGTAGALLAGDKNAENRANLAALAAKSSTFLKPEDPEANTIVWKQFGIELAGKLNWQNASEWFLPSATSKFLWFHQPSIVPIYDTFAANAARSGFGRKSFDIRPKYFERCYQLLTENRLSIRDAKAAIGSTYPYDIRVLDKWLWLQGRGNGISILQKFRSGCRGLAH